MSAHVPPHSGSHTSSPWTPVRAAVGTFAASVVVFGLAFQFVSSVIFIGAGALALGAGAGVLGALRALRSSLARDAFPPPLAAVSAILLIVGVTWGGLGTLRFVTLRSTPQRIANVPNPFASPSSTAVATANPTPTAAPTATPTDTASPGASPSPGPSSSPGAPVLTTVKLPYAADWSKGLAGWAVTPHWQLVDGVLTNDGTSNDDRISATAPIDLTSVRDYVVEADFQLVRYGDYTTGSFGFVVRAVDDRTGYRAGHCANFGSSGCGTFSAGIWDAGKGGVLVNADFKPPLQSWHHYRVEVKGTTITFTAPDVGINLTTTDNAYLSGDQVGLWAKNCQISVKNFTVSAAP